MAGRPGKGVLAVTAGGRIVLALALAGCGAPAGGPLVAEDAASAALLAGAAAAWGRPEAAAEGWDSARATVRWGECPLGGAESGAALGCWDGTTIWLSPALLTDEMAPLRPRVTAHELGHWLRGDGAHLAREAQGGPCLDRERGPALMCPSAGPEVTAADREFVSGE